jgi:nucleosome binding factor SPN SPT16 subunit
MHCLASDCDMHAAAGATAGAWLNNNHYSLLLLLLLQDVVEAARSYLKDRHPHLLPHLTKSLGFALGVDFKEKALELTEKNVHKIKQGMVFALSLGLHDVPLTPQVSCVYVLFTLC